MLYYEFQLVFSFTFSIPVFWVFFKNSNPLRSLFQQLSSTACIKANNKV